MAAGLTVEDRGVVLGAYRRYRLEGLPAVAAVARAEAEMFERLTVACRRAAGPGGARMVPERSAVEMWGRRCEYAQELAAGLTARRRARAQGALAAYGRSSER